MNPSSILRASALVLLVLLPVACSDGGTGEGGRGDVEGAVRIDGDPAEGVELELSGPQRHSALTGSDGTYRFPEVPAGAYLVTVSDAPDDALFPSLAKPVVIADGRTEVVNFDGSFIRTSAITGVVRARGQGLAGVRASLTGVENDTTETDADGRFTFTGLRAGTYRVEIFGLPSRVQFPSVSTEVSLGAGDEQLVTFEGERELTASVVIRSVRSVREDGSTVPADATDLKGTVEVTLSVDRGEDTLERVELLLGDEVVGVQEFGSGEGAPPGEPEGDAPWATSPVDLEFTVNTAAFDLETGEPRFRNGERLLRARLATREGGEAAWVSSRPVVLRNQDTFHGTLSAERGPFTGVDGEDWVGGTLMVNVVPVHYHEDRRVQSVTVELRRVGGGVLLDRNVGGTPPFLAAFSDEEVEGEATLFEYRTPAGAVDQFRVRSATYDDGSAVPGLPVVLVEEVRIDNQP